MIRKHKNLIITLSVILAVVVTAVIFCFTLFTVKDIKLDYRTETTVSYNQEEIIEKSGLDYGKCVFFLKKNRFEANIERNFPYLKVINIETIIPSHIVVHLAERQEFYAVEHEDKILFCDDEFKILRTEDVVGAYESTASNAIVIPKDSLTITNKETEPGQFLVFEENGLKDLYNAMLVNSRSRSEMLALCKKIEVVEHEEKEVIIDGSHLEKQVQTSIKITSHNGRQMFIYNIDYGMKYKFQKMFAVQSTIMQLQRFEYDGVIYDRSSQPDQSLIDQILSNTQIHVKNYDSEYQYDESTDSIIKVYSEKDCYYYLEYNGKLLLSSDQN